MNTNQIFTYGDKNSIVQIRFAGYSDTSAPRLHKKNSDFLFEYILSGTECIESPDYLIHAGIGSLIVIHPSEECVLYRDREEVVSLSLRVSGFVLEAMHEVLGIPKIKTGTADVLDKFLTAVPLFKKYTAGDADAGRRLTETIFSLILDTLSLTEVSDTPSKPSAEGIKAYLDMCLCADTDLDAIGRKFGISSMHIIRLFRQKYDITPMQYLKQKRLEKSAVLLSDSEMSIKDISTLLQFSSTQHFTNLFRENFGVSPGKFRNNNTGSQS